MEQRHCPLVVVPAFNESYSIGEVIARARSLGYEVLVVDDGSSDRTSQAAELAGARVVRLPVNLGVGGALRCAFRYAVAHGWDSVVQCDADGQHPPELIWRLVDAQEKSGAHLVIGSRFGGSGWVPDGRVRRLAIRLLARSATAATGVAVTDPTSGFRMVVEPLLSAFAADFPAGYLGDTFEAVVSAGRSGYRVAETPVEMRARRHGTSSATRAAAFRFLVRSLVVTTARLQFPLRPCPHSGPVPSESS